MPKTAQTPALSPKATEILDFLKAQETPVTLADIKKVITDANSAHLTALRTRGLVNADEIEIEVPKVTKTKVLRYKVKA